MVFGQTTEVVVFEITILRAFFVCLFLQYHSSLLHKSPLPGLESFKLVVGITQFSKLRIKSVKSIKVTENLSSVMRHTLIHHLVYPDCS